jgi:hypothetical protein
MSASPPPSPGDSGSAAPAVPRPAWFAAALFLFLACSWIAFRQDPCPYAYAHQQTDPRNAHWWLKPIEINAPRRLPEVHADFNDVFALKDTGHVWAVGGGGLILHSADSGAHWERQYLVDPKDPAANKPINYVPAAPQKAATAAELRSDRVPMWRRFMPGRPLESALLVAFLVDGKAPPTQRTRFLQNAPSIESKVDSGQVSAQPPQKGRSRHTMLFDEGVFPTLTLQELTNSDLYSVHFIDSRNGWVGGSNGTLFHTENRGRTWMLLDVGSAALITYGVYFRNPFEGVILSIGLNSEDCLIWHTKDQAKSWGGLTSYLFSDRGTFRSLARHRKPDNHTSCLIHRGDEPCFSDQAYEYNERLPSQNPFLEKGSAYAAVAFTDPQHGWIANAHGVLLTTDDAGKIWHRMTRKLPLDPKAAEASLPHRVLPAPWYYLSLAAVAFLFVPALKTPKPRVVSESAADLLISDNPISTQTADVFDFSAVALGLSRFLRNEKTLPPLTIAVTGEWGSGKSSLMNLLRADLARYGFRPVWFNAWHHQKEENLLASLLETVRAQAIPPVWRPEGALFRFKLLGVRWARLWPVIAALLIAFSFSLGYIQSNPDRMVTASALVAKIASFLKAPVDSVVAELKALSQAQGASGHVPWIAFLLSTAGLLVSLWRGLKGFGVNPASLLVKDATRTKLSDLQSLTGFRHRFAAEFRDITHALNPRTLLILIDDLDRCRPEMVLEVLESVNFLVSSGDCYVVLGMARERVVGCVGLSFKDVASELLAPEKRADEAGLSDAEIARRRRIEFAQQYLEKLINIEVPVPSPTDEQSRRLMAGPGAPGEEPRERYGRRLWRELWLPLRKALPLMGIVLLLFLGYWIGAALTGHSAETPAPAAAPAVSASAAPAEKAVAAPSQVASPAPRIATAPATMEPGVEAHLLGLPMILLLTAILIVIVGLGIWRLSIPPGVVIRDSKEFETALQTWHPMVFSFRNTPRSIKRFLNRVRYLAMLQRRQGAEPTGWRAFRDWLLRRPKTATDPGAGGKGHARPIPEEALVALAAIDHCRPGLLEDDLFFVEPQGHLNAELLTGEIRRSLPALLTYREAYFQMSQGIHLS